MTAQEVSVLTEQAHVVVDQFAKGWNASASQASAVEFLRDGTRRRDGQSAYSCQPANITLMRGVPIVGGVRLDMQWHRQRHRRQRRVDHHFGHHRQGLFDLLLGDFEDKLIVHL